jgi:hypothetical protein
MRRFRGDQTQRDRKLDRRQTKRSAAVRQIADHYLETVNGFVV